MIEYIKGAWLSASDPVRIALVVVVGVVLLFAIAYGVDISWLM